jgi:SOS-response transcriptional repressor LexA
MPISIQKIDPIPVSGDNEITSERVPLTMTPSELAMLDKLRGKIKRATYIKHLLGLARTGALSDKAATETVRVPVLATAPGGDFKEAIAATRESIAITPETASELWCADDDVFVRVSGDSMRGAGIIDGMNVLMSPLASHQRPRRGEIALVQIIKGGEVYESTVKRWDGEKDGLPILLDGNDKPVKLPANIEKIIPVAVAKGVMGRL